MAAAGAIRWPRNAVEISNPLGIANPAASVNASRCIAATADIASPSSTSGACGAKDRGCSNVISCSPIAAATARFNGGKPSILDPNAIRCATCGNAACCVLGAPAQTYAVAHDATRRCASCELGSTGGRKRRTGAHAAAARAQHSRNHGAATSRCIRGTIVGAFPGSGGFRPESSGPRTRCCIAGSLSAESHGGSCSRGGSARGQTRIFEVRSG